MLGKGRKKESKEAISDAFSFNFPFFFFFKWMKLKEKAEDPRNQIHKIFSVDKVDWMEKHNCGKRKEAANQI